MPPIVQVILLTTLAGAAMPIGGWLARVESIRPRWLENELRHAVTAFGGGALLAAVALVLVPEGIERVALAVGAVAMLLGGLTFMALDIALARSDSSAANLTAMLADFIPEAIALGASCASPGGAAILLAVLIGLQNLPEGFNAYRELKHNGGEPFKKIINDLLRLVLRARTAPPETRSYVLTPASLGRLRAGVDLDKAMALAGSLGALAWTFTAVTLPTGDAV